jgi:hypothetical protein
MAGSKHVGLVAIIAAGATVTACTGSLTPGVCDDGACGSQRTITRTFQQSISRELDVLFVVDDTAAIAPWLDDLSAGYPAMARSLEDLSPYGIPNLHVGFVRASRCAPQTRARDCGIAASEAFLRHETCGRISNFPSSFVDTFACLADFGTAACAPAQPFEAVRDVLAQPPSAGWDGFLRPEAALQIIFIAGSDAAADAGVADLAAFVRAQKPDSYGIMVSALVPGDCPSAEPTPRLIELVQQFGHNGVSAGLCRDPAGVFWQLRSGPSQTIHPPCLIGALDIDPVAPGLQPDCTFQDTTYAPDGSRATTALPACDVAGPPCWRLHESSIGYCEVAIEIDRGADWCVETLATTRVECLSATM